MTFLRINSGERIEYYEPVYGNIKYSILWVEGNYIPAWKFKADDNTYSVYLEVLNEKLIINRQNTGYILSTITLEPGYTQDYANGFVYALKQSYTLTGLYRLKIYDEDTEVNYYSELFKKLA